jgi:hypothetical protein
MINWPRRYRLTIEIEDDSPTQAAQEVLSGMTADLRRHLLQSFLGIAVVDADSGIEYSVKAEPRSQTAASRTIDGDVLVYADYNAGAICALYATRTLQEAAVLSRALHAQQFRVKVRQWNGTAYNEAHV